MEKTKRKRADGQVTGLAGELFVAAELLKRGLLTSITFGNAKAIDLLTYNPTTGRTFTVQVKSLRGKNFFPISHAKVESRHVYVFVLLNKPEQAVQYYVVPGALLAGEPERFTKWFLDPKFPGIHPTSSVNLRGVGRSSTSRALSDPSGEEAIMFLKIIAYKVSKHFAYKYRRAATWLPLSC